MVVLGRITAPYGIKGWVKLHPFGDDPIAWRQIPEWWLSPEADALPVDWRSADLDDFRAHGSSWIAKFKHIHDRAGAEELVGQFVACPREKLPQTSADEYYWDDLIGLQAINLQGENLGQIERLAETGANVVMFVSDGERERLLPFVASVIRQVEAASGRVLVDWGSDW